MEEKIKEDLKQAQLSRDELKVSTLRLLISEMTNARIQKGNVLEDPDIVAVLRREAKKRKEAAESFRNGGREDSAVKEEAELQIIASYMQEQMSNEELTKLVEDSINNLGAKSMQDMGKVIGEVLGKTGGSVDGSRVSALVREKLQG